MESLIDKYVVGKLEGTVLSEFQERLKTDNELQAKVSERRKIVGGLDQLQADRLRERFAKFEQAETLAEQEKHSTPKILQFNRRRWSAIAAAVLVLLGLGYWIIGKTVKTNEILYVEYYETPAIESFLENGGVKGSDSTSQKNAILKAVAKDFKEKNYQLVIDKINKLNDSNLEEYEKENLNLLLGITYLQIQQYDLAYQIFKKGNSSHHQWYTALAMLQLNFTKAELISEFNQVSPPFKKQAIEIIAAINKRE